MLKKKKEKKRKKRPAKVLLLGGTAVYKSDIDYRPILWSSCLFRPSVSLLFSSSTAPDLTIWISWINGMHTLHVSPMVKLQVASQMFLLLYPRTSIESRL